MKDPPKSPPTNRHVLLPIVEGHSEVESVPVLLRRIIAQAGRTGVRIVRPFRVKRGKICREGELERSLEIALKDRTSVTCVLVLIDADDDCPAKVGPELFRRCKKITSLPVIVVLANREFEAWFLGAKESLRGFCGIEATAIAPPSAERIRGAKEALTQNMKGGRRYLAVDDQLSFVERMDLSLARQRCPSFQRLCKEIERLTQ